MSDYESILCVKNEVFVYNIPPRSSNRGYRAADWKLDNPDYTMRMRIVAKGPSATIKLEDRTSGELFAQCPVDAYPGIAVEAVMDSSRYFVLRLVGDGGRTAFVGIGFQDRADSFDLNVALQDHFRWIAKEKEMTTAAQPDNTPKLDLGFKEGQTIKLNIASKKTDSKQRARPTGGAGLLPPPPPSGKILAPPQSSHPVSAPAPNQQSSSSGASNWVTFD
ncbi:adaptin ear-binding coat-associated protein 1-like [Watersipora subatra]|uniref:adaptin ear-binding coat-associated protein 1-like n=1 Tax=Watersipora subatra TaxID=2589382 RepID=UPI00355C1FB9